MTVAKDLKLHLRVRILTDDLRRLSFTEAMLRRYKTHYTVGIKSRPRPPI